MNDDHETTPDELLQAALLEEIQSIEAYMEKFNKEQSRVQAKTNE